jgi:hypothetical protein
MRSRSLLLVASLAWLLVQICGGADDLERRLIVPGLKVGQMRLGETLAAVHRALGKPAIEDAAMGGRLTEVWRGTSAGAGKAANRQDEVQIYFHGPGAGGDQNKPTVVAQIRVTSPYFRTASGISVNSSFAEISKSYPRAQPDRDWESGLTPASQKKESLVDSVAGIAFEFRAGATANSDAHSYCLAIHVFPPGSKPRQMESFDE